MRTILHVIDSLQVGGTETNLVKVIRVLKDFNHVIVTLRPFNDFGSISENCTVVCIDHKNLSTLIRSIYRLKKALEFYNPDVVRSYLYWSSVIARLACPQKIKCIFSVHSLLSNDVFRNRIYIWLEKLCYRNHHTVIFVSKAVKADYEKVIGLKGKYYILYNFIEGDFFSEEVKRFSNKEKLKMVVIGNFREIKNHMYLLEGLLSNTSTQVSLDIFGDGRLKNEYTTLIRDNQLPVMIKGKCVISRELLIEYDIFVMPSHSEGCPTALQEAMAAGLPLMVSDIEVMHEVTGGNAIFINLTDPKDFVNKINSVLEGNIDLPSLAEKSLSYAKRYYTKEKYMERLIDILSEK